MEAAAQPPGRRPRGRGRDRPCDFCRERKIACVIRHQAPCKSCQKYSRECTFARSPPPRSAARPSAFQHDDGGLNSNNNDQQSTSLATPEEPRFDHNSWVTAAAAPISPGTMPGLEQLFGVFPPMHFGEEDHLPAFIGPASHPADTATFPQPSNSNSAFRLDTVLAEIAQPGSTCSSASSASQFANARFSSKYLGPTSETDPLLRSKYRYDGQGSLIHKIRGIRRLSITNSPDSLALLTPQPVTEGLANRLVPCSIPATWDTLSEHGDSLIKLFLRFVQPQYPVLSPYGLRPDDDSKALLATVYSLSLSWRSYDPELPWEQFNLDAVTRKERPDDGILQQFAWREINRELHAPDCSTVAACLLFMERKRSNMFVADTPFDTCLVGTATSLAFSIGLHKNCNYWNMDTEEKNRRNTLWWLVYVQDRWINIIHGQPPRIREDDFDVPWWDSTQNILSMETQAQTSVLFHHLLELTSILDDIYVSLFSPRHLSQFLSPVLFGRLDNRLRDWKSSFDHLFEMESIEDQDEIYGLGSLLVAYQYCYVLIHRKALRALDNRAVFSASHERALSFGERMLADLKQVKLASFDSFWFSWSRAHFNSISDLIVLLHVSAPTEMARGRAADLAARYRHWLWMRSKSFELVRMGLTRLDSLMKPELWEECPIFVGPAHSNARLNAPPPSIDISIDI